MISPPGSRPPHANRNKAREGKGHLLLPFCLAPVWVFILISLLSCTANGSESSAIVVTNLPYLNVAVEKYNSLDPDTPIQLRPSTNPAGELNGANGQTRAADGIIARGIPYPQITGSLAFLDKVLARLPWHASQYPPFGLVYGTEQQEPLGIPLAVDYPVVVFQFSNANPPRTAEGLSRLESMSMEVTQLRTLAAAHNRLAGGAYNRLGFDPRWDDAFLMGVMRLTGTAFTAAPETEARLTWDPQGLEQALELFRNWHGEGGPTNEQVTTFDQRFGYDPWFQMIRDNRVGYRVMGFSEFLKLDDRFRRDLQFRWLAIDGVIPVMELPVYGVISGNSRVSTGTEQFLSWLVSPEGVFSVMHAWGQTGLPGNHFLGGLPVTPLNNAWHQEFFPGTPMPELFNVRFPEAHPAQWDRIQQEVLLPWVREHSRMEAGSPVDHGSLLRALESWQRLHRFE